jgi:toxin FitB
VLADGLNAAIAATRGFIVATRDEASFRAAGIAVTNPWVA